MPEAAPAPRLQAEFARRAHETPSLRRAHRAHMASAALGAACFALEDAFPTAPFIHTAWHLLSAVGVATTGALVADCEARPRKQG